MRKFRKLGSGLVCAAILTSTMVVFSAPLGAYGGYPVPSNTTICKLLSYALQYANGLPDSSFKAAVLSAIQKEILEHGC
jgi:hypothetical protein